MENGKIVSTFIIIASLIAVAGGIWWFMQNQSNGTLENSMQDNQQGQNQPRAKGTVVVSITDAAANMDAIAEVSLTVSEVQLQGQNQGWVTVSTDTKEFKLLELKESGEFMLYGSAPVEAGTYNQLRMKVDKVVVTQQGGGKKEAKLPSGELKIQGNFTVQANNITSIALDFLADKSLHTTGKGEFIFSPVVAVESRSKADVEVAADNKVAISGGTVDAKTTVGMDIDGQTKVNFILDTAKGVDIENGKIKLKANTGASVGL